MKESNEMDISHTEDKEKDNKKTKLHNFMPEYEKQEKAYRDALLYDFKTKRYQEDGWPYDKHPEQRSYENWLEDVIDNKKGEYYAPGVRHVVNTIIRLRDNKAKKEYLVSKGYLRGYDVTGRQRNYFVSRPEVWTRPIFRNERLYNEKNGSFIEYSELSGTQQVYDFEFSEANAKELFSKVENDDVKFIVKDLQTLEAHEVNWSSVQESLDLFTHKPFNYLFNGEYIPAPVRQEARMEAVAKGLIGGTNSDYTQLSTQRPSYTS